jgi:16S rRNA (guanine527-N7)-methyltransferase
MTIETLMQCLKDIGIEEEREMKERIITYAALLQEWNQKFNLTAVDAPEEAYEKHMLDSLLPLKYAQVSGRVCDVGSGAGFPGMVWAIARSDLSITLMEPTGKRCTFLNTVKETLNLDNVTVINRRAEDCKDLRSSFDTVTARAVAGLSVLSEVCVPLVKTGGQFLPMKGAKGEEELAEAEYALRLLGCGDVKLLTYALPCGEERSLVIAKKVKPTPEKYPRSFGAIKKAPLKEKSHGI